MVKNGQKKDFCSLLGHYESLSDFYFFFNKNLKEIKNIPELQLYLTSVPSLLLFLLCKDQETAVRFFNIHLALYVHQFIIQFIICITVLSIA